MILVEGLKPGQNYKFSMSAANVFGLSFPTLSTVISAGIGSCIIVAIMVLSPLCKFMNADLDQSKEASNAGSIVGGVIGDLLGMLVFTAFIVLLIVVLKIIIMKYDGKCTTYFYF